MASLYSNAKDLKKEDANHVVCESTVRVRKSSAYHKFLSSELKGLKDPGRRQLVMSQCPDKWAILLEEERAVFEQQRDKANRKVLQQRLRKTEAPADLPQQQANHALPPWAMADNRFPLAKLKLEALMQDAKDEQINFVNSMHDKWCTEHQGLLVPDIEGFPDEVLMQERRPQCSHFLGIGRCRLNFSQLELEVFSAHENTLASIWRNLTTEEVLSGRILVLEARDDYETLERFAVGMIDAMWNPIFQLYVWCDLEVDDSDVLLPGEIVTARDRTTFLGSHRVYSFLLARDLSMHMLQRARDHSEADKFVWHYFCAEIVEVVEEFSRFTFEVKEFQLWLPEPKSQETDPEVNALLKVINSKRDPKPPKKKYSKPTVGRGRGRRGGRGRGGPPGDFVPDLGDAFVEMPSDESMEDMQDMGGGGPPAPDDTHDIEPEKPSCYKYIGIDGKPLGTISIFPGTGDSISYSVSCKKHGCSKMVSGWRVPDISKLETWLRLAETNKALSKEDHLKLFESTAELKPLRSKSKSSKSSSSR